MRSRERFIRGGAATRIAIESKTLDTEIAIKSKTLDSIVIVEEAGEVVVREEGRGKREEGRGKREEGRGKREEGRGKRETGVGVEDEMALSQIVTDLSPSDRTLPTSTGNSTLQH